MISPKYGNKYHDSKINASDTSNIPWILSIVTNMHQKNRKKPEYPKYKKQVYAKKNIIRHKVYNKIFKDYLSILYEKLCFVQVRNIRDPG